MKHKNSVGYMKLSGLMPTGPITTKQGSTHYGAVRSPKTATWLSSIGQGQLLLSGFWRENREQ